MLNELYFHVQCGMKEHLRKVGLSSFRLSVYHNFLKLAN